VSGPDVLSEGPRSPSGPAPRSPRRSLDEQTHAILGLLDAGLKDEAVARQLGISLRTVQRAVQQVSVLLGVSSRFQLGAQACRRGWI